MTTAAAKLVLEWSLRALDQNSHPRGKTVEIATRGTKDSVPADGVVNTDTYLRSARPNTIANQ